MNEWTLEELRLSPVILDTVTAQRQAALEQMRADGREYLFTAFTLVDDSVSVIREQSYDGGVVLSLVSDWGGLHDCASDPSEGLEEMVRLARGLAVSRSRSADADSAAAESDYYDDNMTDAEADADTLKSAGWGTDEDYE